MSNQWKKKFNLQISVITAAAVIVLVFIVLFREVIFLEVPANNNTTGNAAAKPEQTAAAPSRGKYKIFHVMSYHSPWEWTDRQLDGFKAALENMDVEYNIMQMDTKRKSSESWKQEISEEIRNAINTSSPDLIFANDDAAQQYVAKYYVNSRFPVVFSAVNEDPAKYGFTGSKNVTGIMEKLHFVPTLRLLQRLVPNVKKVAMISDPGEMWLTLIAEMNQQRNQFADIQVVSYDVIPTFSEFKRKVLDYQNKVDALGFFGVFEFKDKNGENVPMEDVLKWLRENSKLPDFSFWEDRVLKGTLCSVSVSAYEQGYQAGMYARDILLGRKSPAELPVISTEKGAAIINLSTAKRLDIEPSSDMLRLVKVIKDIAL
jgi:ABC-type uncharacterized transport system substrate-binding protein